MRWEQVFEDLAAQWEAENRAQLRGEIADRTRRERAGVHLLDRLCAQLGEERPVDLDLLGGHRVRGVPVDLGADFVVLADGGARRFVRLAAVLALTGLVHRAAAASDVRAARRFGLGYVMRALARDRTTVVVDDVSGGRRVGTIGAVAADHLDLREHPVDRPGRRATDPVRVLPFAAIAAVGTA